MKVDRQYTGKKMKFGNAVTFMANERVASQDAVTNDVDGNPVYLAPNRFNLQVAMERWPQVGFHAIREHGQRMAHA